jgi:hypothetical protein
VKKGVFALHRTHQERVESKPHAVCDEQGRPMIPLLTEAR